MRRSLSVLGLAVVLTLLSATGLSATAGASGTSASPARVAESLGPRTVVPGTWSLVPSPSTAGTSNQLSGVSCVSLSFCMAAGYANPAGPSLFQALIERWNGSSWAIMPLPDTSSTHNSFFDGVSCVTTSFCVAVGYVSSGFGQTLVEQWNGTAWSVVSSPDTSVTLDNELLGVSCLSSSNCSAVGFASNGTANQTLVENWNGTAWSIQPSPNVTTTQESILYSVTCKGPSFCMAVGDSTIGSHDQSLIEQWNGTAWSVVPSPSPIAANDYDLFGVSCASTTMCVAVGNVYASGVGLNLVDQWNGTAWTMTTVARPSRAFGDGLERVDCFGPTSCVAGGYVDTDNSGNVRQTEALSFNGSAWPLSSLPNPASSAPPDETFGPPC